MNIYTLEQHRHIWVKYCPRVEKYTKDGETYNYIEEQYSHIEEKYSHARKENDIGEHIHIKENTVIYMRETVRLFRNTIKLD